jgi:hypothetical protein
MARPRRFTSHREEFVRILAILGAVATLGVACNGPTVPAGALVVAVSPADSTIHLSNRGNLPVGFQALAKGVVTFAQWAPCIQGPGCPTLRPGADTAIAFSSVLGYSQGTTGADVYWWRLVPNPAGGLTADQTRIVSVDF